MYTPARAYLNAVLTSPLPRDWDTPISVPILPISISPTDSHKNSPAVPVAASASLPIRPIQNMSVRLYIICMTWEPAMGKAKRINVLNISPWVRSCFFVSPLLMLSLPIPQKNRRNGGRSGGFLLMKNINQHFPLIFG
jgi:hypothetical protein